MLRAAQKVLFSRFLLSILFACVFSALGVAHQAPPSFSNQIGDINTLTFLGNTPGAGVNSRGVLQNRAGVRFYQKHSERLFLNYFTGRILSHYCPHGVPASILIHERVGEFFQWYVLSPEWKGYQSALELAGNNRTNPITTFPEDRLALVALLNIFQVTDLNDGNVGIVSDGKGGLFFCLCGL